MAYCSQTECCPKSAAQEKTFVTHLPGGVVEVYPAGFAALFGSSGRREGAVPGVGIGLGSGSLLRLWLHLFR